METVYAVGMFIVGNLSTVVGAIIFIAIIGYAIEEFWPRR